MLKIYKKDDYSGPKGDGTERERTTKYGTLKLADEAVGTIEIETDSELELLMFQLGPGGQDFTYQIDATLNTVGPVTGTVLGPTIVSQANIYSIALDKWRLFKNKVTISVTNDAGSEKTFYYSLAVFEGASIPQIKY